MNYLRALVIRFGGLGDILLTTPTLRALHAAYPGLEIDMVVGDGMTEAIAGHPCVRDVMVFHKRGPDLRPEILLPFLRRLTRARYDLVLNLHPSAKSYLMAYATRAPHQITFRKQTGINPAAGQVTHAIEDFAKELAFLGIRSLSSIDLDFVVPEHARTHLETILGEHEVPHGNRLVVINPAASRPINRWPAARFAQVARHFAAQRNTTVVITGGPPTFRTEMDHLDEVALARDIAGGDQRIVNLAGRITIKELGALLGRASAFLTCDTGPMHVGSALHTPMVVLSGAADPYRTGPRVPTAAVMIDRDLPCTPCRLRTCARGDVKCMDNLSVHLVIEAIERCLTQDERYARRVLPVLK